MTTARDIITDAFIDIGIIAENETPSDSDIALGLRTINRMIDTWQTENLLIYDIQQHAFPFVAGQQTYTLGSGGNFDIPRPVTIERASVKNSVGNEYPLDILNADEWAGIVAKYVSTSIPRYLYDDGNFPLKNLNFWPIPTDNTWSVVLYSWGAIQSFTTLDDQLSLPPGYEDALEYNLARRMAPKFGIDTPADIIDLATVSKAQIKRINYTVNTLAMPRALAGKNTYSYADFIAGA